MADARNYQVVIEMSGPTAERLLDQRYTLYAAKGLGGPPNGAPVAWFAAEAYGQTVTIPWTGSYYLFTSRDRDIRPGARVSVENVQQAPPGSVATVGDRGAAVTGGGPAGGISVINGTGTGINCGLAQAAGNGGPSPLAVFPLYGHMQAVMTPAEKVFLAFSSQPVETGTVLERSTSMGILIDLTDAPHDPSGRATRKVRYDLDTGWDAGSAPWARAVAPNTGLAGLLIDG